MLWISWFAVIRMERSNGLTSSLACMRLARRAASLAATARWQPGRWSFHTPGQVVAAAGRPRAAGNASVLAGKTCQLVAQSCTLLYRRFAIGRPSKCSGAFDQPKRRRIQFCGTADYKSALRQPGLRHYSSGSTTSRPFQGATNSRSAPRGASEAAALPISFS